MGLAGSRYRCRDRNLQLQQQHIAVGDEPAQPGGVQRQAAIGTRRDDDEVLGGGVDHDDRAIGILTERDMIRLAAAGSDASSRKGASRFGRAAWSRQAAMLARASGSGSVGRHKRWGRAAAL